MTEVVGNSPTDPTTTLDGSIDDAVESLVVAAWASPLPSDGTFRVRIDDELIAVATVSDTTLGSLTRGIEDTVPAPHASGAAVTLVLTAGGLQTYVAQAVAVLGAFQTVDPDTWSMSQGSGTINRDDSGSFWRTALVGDLVFHEVRATFLTGTAGEANQPIFLSGGAPAPFFPFEVQGLSYFDNTPVDTAAILQQNGPSNFWRSLSPADNHIIGTASGEVLGPTSNFTARFWYGVGDD